MLKRRTLVLSAVALALLISAAIPAQAESSKPTRGGVPGIFVSPDGDGDVNITRRGISTTKTPDFFTNATCSGSACGYTFTCSGATASCTDGSGGGCTVTGGGQQIDLTISCES